MAKTTTWKPAVTSDGRARGTFDGIYTQTFYANDGSEYERDEAIFSVVGEDGKEKPIPVRMSPKFDPKNDLGKLAKSLGFDYKPVYEENNEGLRIRVSDNLEELDSILDVNEGKRFSFKIGQIPDKPGLWKIDLSSLKPFQSSEKTVEKENTTTTTKAA